MGGWWMSLPHAWEGDVRDPLRTVTIAGQPYGLFVTSIWQNIEIALLMAVVAAFAVAVATIVYYFLLPKKYSDSNKPSTVSISAYLLGYGVVLPLWICFPLYLIRTFKITNSVFRFCVGTTPTITIFRTLEAINGFAPDHATETLGSFAFHYVSPFMARYDSVEKKYVKASRSVVVRHFVSYMRGSLIVGALYSVMLEFPDYFFQFGEPYDKNEWYAFGTIFRWQQLWDNLCFAVFFQCHLSSCAHGLQFVLTLLTGYDVEPMWLNAVFESRSFSEFWGKRWNKTVHNALKNGVYKPTRQFASKYVALVATFLASGLFHEWMLQLVFTPLEPIPDDCHGPKCFEMTYGAAIVFFLFQALLIASEYVTPERVRSNLRDRIPGPIATFLVISIGGCMAHWFSDAYVHSMQFLDARVAYTIVRRLDR